MKRIDNFSDFINEGQFSDWFLNKFRAKENPNVLAQEVYEQIREDIKEDLSRLTDISYKESTGLRNLVYTMSNGSKVEIETVEFDEGKTGAMYLTPKKRGSKRIILPIDYSRATRYIDQLMTRRDRNWKKAVKLRGARDVKDFLGK